MTTWIVGLKITALGNGALEAAATLTDGRYRLATGIPAWDTKGVYRDVLAELPDPIGVDVDWQEASCSIPGLTLSLLGSADVYRWLLRPNYARLTTLTAPLSASATSVVLNDTGLSGQTVTVGREAIRLGTTITGSAGAYSYGASTRGVLGTRAYPHGDDATDDTEVFAVGAAPLSLLPVEVFRVRSDGGYSSEETVFRGVLQAPEWDGESGLVRLQVDSALDVLRDSTICRDLFRARRSGALTFKGNGAPAIDTPTSPAVFTDGDGAFVGSVKLVSAGYDSYLVGIGAPAINPGFQSQWAGSTPIATNPEEEDDPGRYAVKDEIWQLFSTYYNAPAVNADGDTLSSNALTHLLQILTTTADGGNGAYDLGVPTLAVGIPAQLIDVAQIEALRESRGPMLELRTLHYPMDGKPVEVSELIGWLLRPFGLALIFGVGGLLQVRALEDGLGSVYTLTAAELIGPPSMRWSGDPVDEVTVSYNDVPGLGPVEQVFSDVYTRERRLSGAAATLEIDARGIEDAAAARLVGLTYATRWRWPIPVLRVRTTRALDAWPGDVVRVTLGALPGRDGARGWTDEACVVSAREVDLASGEHRYDLWWTSAVYGRTGRIGPAARVVSWSAPTATVEANVFCPAGYDPSSDADAWEALIAGADGSANVLILDSDLSVRGTGVADGANGGANTISIKSPTVAPVAGDLIVLRAYDSWGTAAERNYLHARYAYLADAADTLGSAADAAYEWEG